MHGCDTGNTGTGDNTIFLKQVFRLSDSLQELIRIANLSPSSFNLQPWRLIVVRDPERKKVLRRCNNQPKVEKVVESNHIMIADPNGVEENLDRVLSSWQELGFITPEMRDTYIGMARDLYGTKESLRRKIFAAKNTALLR